MGHLRPSETAAMRSKPPQLVLLQLVSPHHFYPTVHKVIESQEKDDAGEPNLLTVVL
jgi:hypothetical protein